MIQAMGDVEEAPMPCEDLKQIGLNGHKTSRCSFAGALLQVLFNFEI